MAGALSEAHGIGLIHRDIKPANVFLSEQGGVPDVAKVLDFGLLKEVGDAGSQPALTHNDTLTGTPLYMVPKRSPLRTRSTRAPISMRSARSATIS